MFCVRCGSPMQPDSQPCAHCGRRIGDPVSAVAQSRLERHLHTLAVLWMAIGGLFLIPSVILMLLGSTFHIVINDREPFGAAFGPLVLYVIGGSLLILGTGGVCVGLGLEIIDALDHDYPGLGFNLCYETGELRPYVNIFLDRENSRYLQGLETPIQMGATIHILQSVAGGCS